MDSLEFATKRLDQLVRQQEDPQSISPQRDELQAWALVVLALKAGQVKF